MLISREQLWHILDPINVPDHVDYAFQSTSNMRMLYQSQKDEMLRDIKMNKVQISDVLEMGHVGSFQIPWLRQYWHIDMVRTRKWIYECMHCVSVNTERSNTVIWVIYRFLKLRNIYGGRGTHEQQRWGFILFVRLRIMDHLCDLGSPGSTTAQT